MKSIEIIKCMLNNIFILMHITHYFFFLELRDGLVFISTIGGVFSTGTGSWEFSSWIDILKKYSNKNHNGTNELKQLWKH